ncbi:MAG: NAD-dependent epimerase/dehydratase family protein [Ardenticatenales bacterium]|nr:NAD-dependent epimerase/dehydratase family protein [Ardenticatenales bacterium]
MKLLILGGTIFVGLHLVEAALARGHEITLFNRGKHNAELFPEVEKLRGDRGGDLASLEGRRWDAVIDTTAYIPRAARATAALLADAVDHYTLISSISVYADRAEVGATENSALETMEDETVEEVTGETYGPLKVLCERAVEETMPGRTLVVRPGLIVGPHDPTDRFTYWPYRVAEDNEVLAPGNPEQPVQVIDVRDLAEWNIRLVEAQQTGIYHATGPERLLPMRELLETCRRVSSSVSEFTWVSEEFLLANNIAPFSDLPLWVPEAMKLFGTVDCSKAIAAGLTYRPLEETIRDTLAWANTRPESHEWKACLTRERERELLALWRER